MKKILQMHMNYLINIFHAQNSRTGVTNHKNFPLTLSNPIFLPPAYYSALIYFGRERGWWITCNCPTVLKEKT
jgi:hypothetical protein